MLKRRSFIFTVRMALQQLFPIAVFMLLSRNPSLPCGASPIDTSDPEVCQSTICQESAQFLLDCMDTSVDPCDDFYRYACGGWIDKHSIPEGKTSYSSIEILIDQVNDNVAEILKNATNENHTKAVLDAAILFQGCTDEEAREIQGLNPLKNVLNSLGGWPAVNPEWSDAGYEWYTQVATLRRTLGLEAIISVEVETYSTDTSRHVVSLSSPAFGLSDEYLKDLNITERNTEIITAYRNYIIATGKLINPSIDENLLGNDADEIIQFESDLSQANYSVGEYKTVSKWYHEFMDYILHRISKGPVRIGMPISEVQKITENEYFKWTDFLSNVFQDFREITNKTKIQVVTPIYIRHALKLAHETDPRIIANYIGWTLMREIGGHTTKEFRDNAFRFKQVLNEEQEDTPKPEKLERVCADETIELLGFAVGRLYVDKYLSEEAKHDVEELIEDIRSAYELNFIHNDWMDPNTKNKALEKLRAMVNLVAYPEWIKNDEELNDYYGFVQDVNKDEYFASWVKVKGGFEAKTLMKWNQSKQHRAIEWDDYPPVVNAYYYPLSNTMTFPAGIISPPVYKYGRLPALNHAGIGSVVAHEISHGFDDTGSHYDKDGRQINWWSKETKAKFENKTECFKEQYSSYMVPMSNMSINGFRTLGDNIADNGGVRNAFMAYKLEILQSQENEVIGHTRLPGLSATPQQLFFLGYASLYCSRETKKSIEWTIEHDVHSPKEYRIIGPLSNSKAFAEAFNCPVGSRMNPESKCHLW